ncbi:unnamed protein product [Cladocopium goreaui]|uniref:Uncharacterized protein n=1 Tax=Cladocopium goreaui TaxID=2562237 RepID=A0A9P1GAJ9_9DINO|nr:unnamed protein product [Cladocopium goreaui]
MACTVLLALNSGLSTFTESYDFAELFCGQAWVSRCMRTAGHRTAMLDISLGRPNDDLKKQDAMDLLSDSGFALALLTVLNCRMDSFLVVIGLICSSFVTISQGTHCRAPFFPLGREGVKMVFEGNQLASRTALLIWAIVAMGGCFVLEQPRSSQLGWHPRIVELFRALPKVFQAAWWMGLYKHVSPKRHVAWSNAPTVQCLDLGHMTRAMQKKATSQPTARSYRNKRGEKKFHGTRFLKGTQTYPPRFGQRIARLYKRFCTKRVALPEPAGPVDGYQIFENCQWNDWWDDACMKSVIYYLRASKDLEASIADQDTQPVSWHIVTGCFRWEHTCYHPKLLSQTCSSIPKATPEELKQARSKAKAKPKPAAAKSKPRAPPSPQPSPPAKGTPNPAPTKRVRGKQHEPDDHDTASSGSGQRDQAQMIQDLMESASAFQTPPPTVNGPTPKSKSKETEVPKGASGVKVDLKKRLDPNEVARTQGKDPPATEAAKLARLRRLCEKKPSGKCHVPEELHKRWLHGSLQDREALVEELEAAHWSKDLFVSRVTKTITKTNKLTRKKKRGWFTKETMNTVLKWSSTYIKSVVAYCEKPGNERLVKKDRYNKKIHKYYVVYGEEDDELSEDEEKNETCDHEVGEDVTFKRLGAVTEGSESEEDLDEDEKKAEQINTAKKEYLKFCTFTASLLKRGEKLADLIGMLEAAVGDKEPEKARVAKPLSGRALPHQSNI